MPDIVRILIVDERAERGNALREHLAQHGFKVGHLRFPKNRATLNPEESPIPQSWSLGLIHANDIASLERFEQRYPLAIMRRVFYGGKGGADDRIPNGAERIWKVMEGNSALLSEKECGDLHKMAKDTGYVPPMLQRGVSLPVLRVLAVLTMLYTAVRAAKLTGTEAESDHKGLTPLDIDAFERLGWFRMGNSVRQRLTNQPDALPWHDENLNDPKWWFNQLKEARQDWREILTSELTLAKSRGLSDVVAIEELANLISNVDNGVATSEKDPKDLPAIIMKAYLSLAELKEW